MQDPGNLTDLANTVTVSEMGQLSVYYIWEQKAGPQMINHSFYILVFFLDSLF